MKKIISLILTVMMIVSSLTMIVSAATVDGNHGFVPGDCNDDLNINMKDILVLRRFVGGLQSKRDIDTFAADVNGDSNVDMKDILKLRRAVAGLETLSRNNTDNKYKVGSVSIGNRNISRFTIIIPSDADACMQYSARELKEYIRKACGVTLNIAKSKQGIDSYYIEYKLDTDNKYDLGKEGYFVKVEDDGNLTLNCGTMRGCLYVTYYLLEKFVGWRFLNEDNIKYLYESDNVNLPVGFEDTEVPVFEYRGLNQVGTTSENFARLRLNALDARGSGTASHTDHNEYGGGAGNLYIHGHSYEYQEAVGLKLDEAGVTDLDSNEAMRIFSIYAYNSPEHYALVEEKKLSTTQPCLSSETTFRYIMDFNYLLYKERTLNGNMIPGVHYTMLSCSPNDTTKFCTCKTCKAVYSEEGSIAGTVFRLSNRVAKAQREIMPGVGVYTIAYWDARNPPKYTRPEDDVCVCFCFGGCNNHTYDHVEECEAAGGNSRYPGQIWDVESQKVVDAPYNISNVQDLDYYTGWAELTNNLYVWYYACNFYYFISPCPNVLNIYNDFKYLASTGTIGIYTEGSSRGYTFEKLRGYLASRMMWDPYMSEEEFEGYLDEYLMICYGPGWRYIKDYVYEQDHCGNLQGCFMNNFDHPWEFYNIEYYRDNFDRFVELFENAANATTDPNQLERLEKASIHVYFLGLSATYKSDWCEGDDAAKATYKDRYDYLWNYINDNGYMSGIDDRKDGYKCVDLPYHNGVGGLDNFPNSKDDVYDTMFWVDTEFSGFFDNNDPRRAINTP